MIGTDSDSFIFANLIETDEKHSKHRIPHDCTSCPRSSIENITKMNSWIEPVQILQNRQKNNLPKNHNPDDHKIIFRKISNKIKNLVFVQFSNYAFFKNLNILPKIEPVRFLKFRQKMFHRKITNRDDHKNIEQNLKPCFAYEFRTW